MPRVFFARVRTSPHEVTDFPYLHILPSVRNLRKPLAAKCKFSAKVIAFCRTNNYNYSGHALTREVLLSYAELFCKDIMDSGLTLGLFGLGRSSAELLRMLDGLPRDRIILRDERRELSSFDTRGCRVAFGEEALRDIREDLLIVSPSVRRDRAPFREALERGTCISSDCELFFRYLEGLPRGGRRIGVTGSDGKSTVTALASLLLTAGGLDTPAIGNIGVPFCTHKGGGFVAELSSFNLSYCTPPLDAAAITSLSPNHLNWHTSLCEYFEAKARILARARRIVLPTDGPAAALSAREPDAVFSVSSGYRELSARYPRSEIYSIEDGCLCRLGERIVPVAELTRREKYNLSNMLCAAALVGDNVGSNDMARVFSSFGGLAHRGERIPARDITFIDSSIDTSPARTAATLDELDGPIRLILGGRGKGLSYSSLLPHLAGRVATVALYGEAAVDILSELEDGLAHLGIAYTVHRGFDDAFDSAVSSAREGDTVLLSPACTAYGEFSDFEERGRHFAALVENFTR